MPTTPKPPGQRRRRNVQQQQWRTFSKARAGAVPPLPKRTPTWSRSTVAWWRRVWRSPMATAYLDVDVGALHRLAELVERGARGELGGSQLAAMTQLEDRFGLTPKARQILSWQVLAADGPQAPAASSTSSATAPAANVRRLRAVDPQAAAGS